MTGTNTYSGTTTVSEASLEVDGSQPSSSVVLKSGSGVGGSGTTGSISAVSGGIFGGKPQLVCLLLSGVAIPTESG